MIENNLTLSALDTSALELRHLVLSRPAHKKSMHGGGGGRRRIIDQDTRETAPAQRYMDSIPANPVSFLTLRELMLHDWALMNYLCSRCSSYRRDCLCKHPKWVVFAVGSHGAMAGTKRKQRDFTVPKVVKQEACQFVCGKTFKSFGELFEHEQQCELRGTYSSLLGPKLQLRKWETERLGEDSDGSHADELQD